jgi:hypothetical protein
LLLTSATAAAANAAVKLDVSACIR